MNVQTTDKYTESELEDLYREFLREVYPTVDICGIEMDPVRILEEMDPTAFRCGCNDWVDGEYKDGNLQEYVYTCGVCGEEFDDEDEAEECCKEEEEEVTS